jgi:hypothetical protein
MDVRLKATVERQSKTHSTDRFVDVASVALISLAAVLTAACTYQSALWATQRTQLFNEANRHRLEAATAAGRSNMLETIDVGLFVQYVAAEKNGNASLGRYLLAHLRPAMRPAMNAWLAMSGDARPNSPFDLPEYRLATDVTATRETSRADEAFTRAQRAGDESDQFVRVTLTFATVSFLAAMSTKFAYPNHLIMIVLSVLLFLYAAGHLTQLHVLFK